MQDGVVQTAGEFEFGGHGVLELTVDDPKEVTHTFATLTVTLDD